MSLPSCSLLSAVCTIEVTEELEKQIEKLEEAKQKWSEIPQAYNQAMQEIAASDYFGADWRNLTLFPSDELLNGFQNSFENT